jgi:glycopeptide antibiotics resistance protein
MGNLPGFLPVTAASFLVAWLFGGRVAGWLTSRLVVGRLLVVAVGIIVAATLTPLRGAFEMPSPAQGSCDLTRLGLIPINQLLTISDPSLNVLLFVPLGVAIGLIPDLRKRLLILMLSIALPPAIELTQLVVTDLLRGCQSADVIDNLTGLFIGLAATTAARIVTRAWAGVRSTL